MPRRNSNAKTLPRRVYSPDAAAALARIEEKRRRLDISIATLALRAGLTERQLYNIRRTQRASPRRVKALTFALRSIERERQAEAEAMPQ